jgi:hypothetical protein
VDGANKGSFIQVYNAQAAVDSQERLDVFHAGVPRKSKSRIVSD